MTELVHFRTATPLALEVLCALHSAEGHDPAGRVMSLPRLGKQLRQSASVLLRTLSTMGETVPGRVGPGWVLVKQLDGRWTVCLTDVGRVAAAHVSVAKLAEPGHAS